MSRPLPPPVRLLRPYRRTPWGIWPLMALALGLAWVWGAQAYATWRQAQALEDQRAQRMADAAIVRPATTDAARRDGAAHWRAVRQSLAVPWGEVLGLVERAANDDIELTEIAVDPSGGRVVLRGEARDRAGLLAMLERLAAPADGRSLRLRHEQQVVRGSVVTLRFELEAALINEPGP